MFTDLVGSTALSSSLPPGEAEALRRTHLGLLREAVASTGGVEVKNLGDGLMVAFASPSGALGCAVAMQRAIERHNRRGGPSLAVRIGISGGEVTEDDGDYFGDPVVEAARLCASAEGDQILVARAVRVMAGRNAPAAMVEVGDLDLKGLPDPVPTAELRWQEVAVDHADVPLPARLAVPAGGGIFPFTGRRAELGTLAELCNAAGDGRIRVGLVAGEPGVGKTALVAEAARAAHGSGAAVTFGASREGLAAPYQPWIAALTHLVTHAPDDALAGLKPVHAGALAALLPSVAGSVARDPVSSSPASDSERLILLDAVAALLERLSADVEVVVVLDDLQWADAASVDTLRHLLTSPTTLRVTVLATYRSSDLSQSDPLAAVLADLRREPTMVRLDLGGLDDIETVELLERAAGFELPPEATELAHALRQETGGNPFFTVEVLRHLAETGALQAEADGTYSLVGGMDALVLPSSVREVVGHRVRRLGDDVEQLLRLASVVGVEFDLEVLAAVSEQGDDNVLDQLEIAARAGIVGESGEVAGRYRFVHALIAHTLAHDLGPTRRQRIHQRVAEALEASGAEAEGRVAELAHHWLAAGRPADTDRAVHYAMRAGRAALDAFAPADAVTWYQRALELVERRADGDPLDRGRLLAGLGRAQLEAGLVEHRETLREAGLIARGLRDRDLLVDVALCRWQGFEAVSTVDRDRLAVIETALEVVGDDEPVVRTGLLVALADETDRREIELRHGLVGQALAIARRIPDEETRADTLVLQDDLIARPDNTAERLALSEEMLGWTGPTQLRTRFSILLFRHNVALELGDRDLVDACWRELQAIDDEAGTPYTTWQCGYMSALWLTVDGDLDAAEQAAGEAFEHGARIGATAAAGSYGLQLMGIRLQQGRLDEMVDLIAESATQNEMVPGWDSALALVCGEAGRRDEQLRLLEVAHVDGFSSVPFDMLHTHTLAFWSEAAADLEHEEAAAVLVEMQLPFVELVTTAVVHTHGAVARSLGRLEHVLGRHDVAEQHLRQSLAVHERLRAPYWIARSQIDLAALLRDLGRAGEAAALVEEATASIDRFGFGGLHRRLTGEHLGRRSP